MHDINFKMKIEDIQSLVKGSFINIMHFIEVTYPVNMLIVIHFSQLLNNNVSATGLFEFQHGNYKPYLSFGKSHHVYV